MTGIRVVLVDDHSLVRAGFRALLEALPGVTVVAEASNGRDALDLTAEHRPHLVLMDIAMPGLNGLDAVRRMSQGFPHVHVLILSMHANEEYVLRALRAGAAGYLLKDSTPDELAMAVEAVVRGDTYLSPAVSGHLADYVRRTAEAEECAFDRLTPRQREVLQLVAEGHTSQSIATMLGISLKTVESHRMGLMRRLDIHDIAGLVRCAIENGMVSVDGSRFDLEGLTGSQQVR